MSSPSGHPELGPELRALAQAILDRLDPMVRAAAAMANDTLRGPGSCQQVWCPVCALAALASGEQHPMLTLLAEHSVVLMTMVRDMVTEPAKAKNDDQVPEETPVNHAGAGTRYEAITIVIESVATESVSSESVFTESAGPESVGAED